MNGPMFDYLTRGRLGVLARAGDIVAERGSRVMPPARVGLFAPRPPLAGKSEAV
jgi:hypothetical protein